MNNGATVDDIFPVSQVLGLMSGGNQTSTLLPYASAVGSFSRWNINRQLKSTTAALRHAEGELRIEREQLLSYRDDAADAVSFSVLDGNAADRDEAFRARRHLDRSSENVARLQSLITNLRAEQDELLDRMSSSHD